MLEGMKEGTFLVRFSNSQPGEFSISYSTHKNNSLQHNVTHLLIEIDRECSSGLRLLEKTRKTNYSKVNSKIDLKKNSSPPGDNNNNNNNNNIDNNDNNNDNDREIEAERIRTFVDFSELISAYPSIFRRPYCKSFVHSPFVFSFFKIFFNYLY